MADDTIAKIGIDVDVTGAEEAGSQLDKLGKKGKKTEGNLNNLAKGANKTNGPFRAMRGSMQQVSWQLQDVAVQAQMGTSAFTILGQQGPQLASIFGPGGAVVGAIVAFGAMIGGVLYNSLTGASELTKELTESTKDLHEETDNLNGALRELAVLQAAKRQKELEKAIVEATAEMEKSEVVIKSVALGAVVMDSTLEKANDTITQQKGVIAAANNELKELARQNDGVSDSTEKLNDKLREELLELQLTEEQFLRYKAAQGGATAAQIEGIVAAQGLINSEKEKAKALEDAEKALKKSKEELASYSEGLYHQLAALHLSGDALYYYQAALKGGTAEQITANAELLQSIALRKEKIKSDADAAKAKAKADADAAKAEERAEQDAQKLATAAAQRGLDSVTQLALQHQAERDQLQEHLKKKRITQEEYDAAIIGQSRETADALSEIDKKALADKQAIADAKAQIDQQLLSSASALVGQLAGVAEEGSREAKILFGIEKGIAVATTIINAHVAAQQAMTALPYPMNVAASNMVLGMGYASAGVIAGTAIAGGRALGGQVRGGESYLVGERGPELLTMGTSGRIATNENLKNAVGGDNNNTSNVVNVNFSVQANDTAGFDRLLQSRRGQIVGMINQAVNNRGRSSIV